jgi:hypothetical protein
LLTKRPQLEADVLNVIGEFPYFALIGDVDSVPAPEIDKISHTPSPATGEAEKRNPAKLRKPGNVARNFSSVPLAQRLGTALLTRTSKTTVRRSEYVFKTANGMRKRVITKRTHIQINRINTSPFLLTVGTTIGAVIASNYAQYLSDA